MCALQEALSQLNIRLVWNEDWHIAVPQILLFSFSAYLLLVRVLRYRNLRKIQSLAQRHEASKHIPLESSHTILNRILLYEFPFMYGFATQWALIKSYGAACGTPLLVATKQLSEKKNVGKRAEDTGLILGEILINGVDTQRGARALAKMNWLHRKYGNRISNEDMIWTLGLFVLEPIHWIDRYEWRKLSSQEKDALWMYWKEIGMRMGIKGIPDTLDDMEAFMDRFIEKNVYFAESNQIVADATLELFLRDKPRIIHGAVKKLAAALMDDRVRPALGWAKPPRWTYVAINVTFWIRAIFVKYLLLPRLKPALELGDVGKDGKLHRTQWQFEPWYVPETLWSKVLRALGFNGDRLPGPEFMSDGYLPEELGPKPYKEVAATDVFDEADMLLQYGRNGGGVGTGCPFGFGK